MNRRGFLSGSAAAMFAAQGIGAAPPADDSAIPEYQKPVFDLHKFFPKPVKIASIELLQANKTYFVRMRSTEGAEGIIQTKDVEDFVSILLRRVAPQFVGKDARDLEKLVDGAYIANYKLSGQALWCPIAYCEQSCFDMLGKLAHKQAAELMGGVLRKEIPVYLSGSGRDTTAEEEVDVYVKGVAETGAKALKFKIGGRMSANQDAYPGRTDKILELAAKRFDPKVTLMADANGSYSAAKGIEIGRKLQDLHYLWFEEPCPWEELSETKKVADALNIKIAYGEQNSSLWQFQWCIENGVMDVVQPDLNYNGGFTRAARVARMARKHNNMWICPHNTQTGAASVNILHFAASTPNIGPWMEYVHRGEKNDEPWYTPNFKIRNGVIALPPGPGLGLTFDPDFLKKAKPVTI
ncbi:MAG TPA: mandelate racemase/muconate lactonizing enzyme family protein [Bryobacteraceae bacterium]|jgi:L-alanine-DL-glutamate epimerase-like enolase superfamily enzyme|nr:mandelate racemase/muconate lactonizing enzyme family protein [Bryobacteraceae bacterium]